MLKKKKAFTLIELVVVMAIIAVLAVLIVAAITAARRQSTNTARMGNAKTIETALESWAAKNSGQYPYTADTKGSTINNKLKTDSALTNNVLGTSDDKYFVYSQNGSATANATKYTLTACDVDTTAIGTAPTAGTADTVGATGPCTGGTVVYSTAR